jgi:beta-phosphoglucomutase
MSPNTAAESHSSLKLALSKAQAVLFDFDGVIADTEQYQAKSYAKLLADYGINFTKDDFKHYVGNSEMEIYSMLKRRYNIPIDVLKANKSRADYLITSMVSDNLRPYPYISPVLAYLNRLGSPAYILSANNLSTIQRLLRHWSLEACFAQIYTVFDFSDALTKAQLIEMAPRLTGYSAEELTIFEDSRAAIETANRMGMVTVGVLSSIGPVADLAADIVIDPMSYLGDDLQ